MRDFFGARDENRTHTGIPIRPSNVRVYQFRHSRIAIKQLRCIFYEKKHQLTRIINSFL